MNAKKTYPAYKTMINDLEPDKYSNESYHFLFDQATDAIMVTDFEGNFKDVNSSLCSMFGYTRDELLHMNVSALLDSKHLKNQPIRFDILREGESIFNERKMVDKKGTVIYVECNAKKFMDDRILAIARDITSRKALEQELLNQKVQEQKKIIRAVLQAQEIQSNRIGQELHDNISQVLSCVKLYLDSAEKDDTDNKELIKKSKEFIDMAIGEIRLLSSRQVTPQITIDIKDLIEELLANLNERTLAGTKFYCDVEARLPIDEDMKLNIYRIVQEQVNNIIKYAAASEASISIYENNGMIYISVTDNGRGFDPLIKRKGIGISNIINRIGSFNGEVIIESSPGAGCKLEIKIPC